LDRQSQAAADGIFARDLCLASLQQTTISVAAFGKALTFLTHILAAASVYGKHTGALKRFHLVQLLVQVLKTNAYIASVDELVGLAFKQLKDITDTDLAATCGPSLAPAVFASCRSTAKVKSCGSLLIVLVSDLF
jgi:hypothetical protein